MNFPKTILSTNMTGMCPILYETGLNVTETFPSSFFWALATEPFSSNVAGILSNSFVLRIMWTKPTESILKTIFSMLAFGVAGVAAGAVPPVVAAVGFARISYHLL